MPPRSLPRWELLGIGRRHRLCQGDGEIHGKGGPLPQMALHGDGAAHSVDEALDDGEPQAGALDVTAELGMLLGEGGIEMIQEALAHAHAGVLDGEKVYSRSSPALPAKFRRMDTSMPEGAPSML